MMVTERPAKKSETIEIRLPYDLKTAFMHRCRRQGTTASDVLRAAAARHVAGATGRPPRMRRRWLPVAAGLAGLALGAGLATPSLARSGDGSRAAFARLDRNHDGVLDYGEFHAR